ncbi:uncharacterized protein LOC126847773 isoform X1 [Adelges cooleyi]|uniref:uncharacterized protein LOC126847773 isoform X1 n=1 Tax=Adelges cooleyi TaxID=133065 RepID=UPI00217F9365|nr:uncharacterized protein LOC126847773 isoform X1 [Adelges cooleyi]
MSKRVVKKIETAPKIEKNIKPIPKSKLPKTPVVKKTVIPKKLTVQTSVDTIPKPSSAELKSETDKVIERWEKLVSESYTLSCRRTAQETFLGEYSISTSDEKLSISTVNEGNQKDDDVEKAEQAEIKLNKKSIGDNNTVPKPIDNVQKLKIELDDEKKTRKLLEDRLQISEKKDKEARLALATNIDEMESLTCEMEKLQNANSVLTEQYEAVAAELENQKTNNSKLNDLYNAVVDRCKYLEDNGNNENVSYYTNKLEEITGQQEMVIAEKNSLQSELDESNATLDNLQQRIEIIMEESARKESELTEKLTALEEENTTLKQYQTYLEEQIDTVQKALARKDQYIKQHEFMVDELTKDKRMLEKSLNTATHVQPYREEEMENYRRQIKNLTASIVDMKNAFAITEAAYNKEMEEVREELQTRDKLLTTKNKTIQQQDQTLRLMKEMNATARPTSVPEATAKVKRNSFTEEHTKWRKIYDDIELESTAFSDSSAIY